MTLPKRICFLENGTMGGGSFASLFLLVTNLDRTKYEPIVVFVNHTLYVEKLEEAGVRTVMIRDSLYSLQTKHSIRQFAGYARAAAHHVGSGVSFVERAVHRSTMNTLIEFMRAERIDLLHCNNNPIRDYYGIAAAAELGIPCVSHIRSLRVGNASNKISTSITRGVAQFIANSKFAAEFWEKYFEVPNSITTVVPNAIEFDVHSELDVRSRWDIPNHAKVVGCIANFAVGKGQDFLLSAFNELVKRIPDTVLLFVGDGSLREDVEDRARGLGILNSVRFVGYSDEARSIMAGCDVVVVPSETEAFGRTVLEAMSVETPVVATRVGGIPELIEDGESGLMVTYGDVDEMTEAISNVLNDSELSRTLAISGKQKSLDYTVEKHIESISNIYENIITSHSGRSI